MDAGAIRIKYPDVYRPESKLPEAGCFGKRPGLSWSLVVCVPGRAGRDGDRPERGYEVHLDRKLERMLTMLLRLKDLRQATVRA
jgi:hypothetical protein